MAIKNLGNFKRTTGKYDMTLDDGTVIEFEKGYNSEDLLEFVELFSKDKNPEKFRNYFEKVLDKYKMFEGTGLSNEDKKMFIIKKTNDLMKGFMIMFELIDSKSYDDAIEKAKLKMQGEVDNPESPIVE